MRTFDTIAFSAYLVGIVALGVLVPRKDRSDSELFLAGRTMHWFPIGLSVMVTAFSAINYTALPTEVFSYGLYVAISFPVFVLVAFPVTRIFMPFYHRMRLTSAYEYLERRFDVRVRCLASALFILWRVLWMATALYASGRILGSVTGIDHRWIIAIAGIAAALYTAAGGIRAVMWTDAAQFFVLFGGIVAGLGMAVWNSPGGVAGLLQDAGGAGLLRPAVPFDPDFFSFDPRIRITFWSGLVGTFTGFLARYGADQVVVQRYFTARSLRHARLGFWCNVVCAIAAMMLLAAFGLAIHAHAARTGTLGAAGWTPLQHMAQLVRSLPDGACGLIAAGLLAATMSSIDSGLNACTTAYMIDFHHRLKLACGDPRIGGQSPPDVDGPGVSHAAARPPGLLYTGLTVSLCASTILLALHVERLGSLFAIANRIINGLGSPLLALILLGMFSRRVNSTGMLAGGITGACWSVWVSFGVRNLALHYYAVVNLAGTLVACALFSVVAGWLGARNTPEQLDWTWYHRRHASPEPEA